MIGFSIQLEARDDSRNMRRAYRISLHEDLFGDMVVELRYGRIGAKGRVRQSVMESEQAAWRYIRQCLKRRASAPRRIGVPYAVREMRNPPDWLLEIVSPPSFIA